MKEKRFIDGTDFSEKLDLNEFEEKWKKIPMNFNEEGIATGCPKCDYCQDGFIKIDLPDIESSQGKQEFDQARRRMKNNLDIHKEKEMQLEIEMEIEKMKIEINSKIRQKYKLSQ